MVLQMTLKTNMKKAIMTSSGSAYLGKIKVTIINHGQHINEEGNKCMILTVFKAMGLDVEEHFEIIINAARLSEITYNEIPEKIKDHRDQQIKMHDSLNCLLTFNSLLEISVFQRIKWHPDWTKFMMVVISSKINSSATEVNIFYHFNEADPRDQISAKKVIFLHLDNLHFQGAIENTVLPTTVVDLLPILKEVESTKGVVVSQYNCDLPPLLLASQNGEGPSSDIEGLIKILKLENVKKRKVPVAKKVLELFIYFIIL
jgi:hypothetical protein